MDEQAPCPVAEAPHALSQVELSIVIPAYNEEAGIAATLAQALAACTAIEAEGAVRGVEIIVVDDGSTDQTAAIVSRLPGVRLLHHPTNQGYGAALKTGFAAARGELLAFMDGDGTCDPQAFGVLCRVLQERGADLVVGARLGAGSQMPHLRRLGNRVYAQMVQAWSQQPVTDVASGMRIVRRRAYGRLAPWLPDGMHFTPAMSCRALLDDTLSVAEAPIPYRERVGRSKLHVLQDGARFLRTIIEVAVMSRPLRLFGLAGAAMLLVAMGCSLWAVSSLPVRPLGSWLLFRLIAVMASASAGLALVTTGVVAQRLVDAAMGRPLLARRRGWLVRVGRHFERHGMLWGIILGLLAVAAWVGPVREYTTTRQLSGTWPAFLLGGVFGLVAVQLASLGVLGFIVERLTRDRVEAPR